MFISDLPCLLVRTPGVEPGRNVATDFKSVVSTSSTMSALARSAGLEPATHSLEGCCSNPTELQAQSGSKPHQHRHLVQVEGFSRHLHVKDVFDLVDPEFVEFVSQLKNRRVLIEL